MSITEAEDMKDFNAIDSIEVLAMQETWCIIRTNELLPTLQFMQQCWWHIWELTPDDADGVEYNLLTFYKKQHGKN